MKKYFTLLAIILALGCSSDDKNDKDNHDVSKFRTPDVGFISQRGNAFTGVLQIYPCAVVTSDYVGNYKGLPPTITVLPATYLFGKNGYLKTVPPLLLPLGEYTLIYWGVPNTQFLSYDKPQATEPPITLGGEMKNAVISLRPTSRGSLIFNPTYDYVFGRQEIKIGQDALEVALERTTGGIIIDMTNDDGTPLDETIKSVVIFVSNLAKSVNFYDGTPSDYTATVRFPLTISEDRMEATNNAVMLFPSSTTAASNVTIEITLMDGNVKKYTKPLAGQIEAGNILTVNVRLGDILITPPEGGFQVPGWTESSDTIIL